MYENRCDFIQGMTEQEADRMCDPQYIAALMQGGEVVEKQNKPTAHQYHADCVV